MSSNGWKAQKRTKIEGASENATEGQCGRKRIRNLEGFRTTGI